MNSLMHFSATDAAGPAARPADHQFALLTARAGLEPELAQRYTSDPVSVLAEFGLPAMEPVYGDRFPAGWDRVPAGTGRSLVIDHLDRPSTALLYGCATIMASLPGEEAETALA